MKLLQFFKPPFLQFVGIYFPPCYCYQHNLLKLNVTTCISHILTLKFDETTVEYK